MQENATHQMVYVSHITIERSKQFVSIKHANGLRAWRMCPGMQKQFS